MDGYVEGIDVSNHQGAIDWPRVAASGVKWAYVKATEGAGFVDPWYDTNLQGALDHGIAVGAYHFARPGRNHWEPELRHFLAHAQLDRCTLPPVLDLEDLPYWDHFADWAHDWLTSVARHYDDAAPVLYVGAYYGIPATHPVTTWPWWLPAYPAGERVDPDPATLPKPSTNGRGPWDIWQYTGHGRTPGVTGNCDRNLATRAWFNTVTNQQETPVSDNVTLVAIAKRLERIDRRLDELEEQNGRILNHLNGRDTGNPHDDTPLRTGLADLIRTENRR